MDKIVCLGKNYVAHVREIGEAIPDKPVIFMKPPSAVCAARNGEHLTVHLPPAPGRVHAECEIVLRLDHGGYRMNPVQAEECIGAVTVGLDMTLYAKHQELKQNRQPWTTCKAFPESAVIGPWRGVGDVPRYMEETFSLAVAGAGTQSARGHEMMLKPAASVAYISQFLLLEPGDLIFTGTPQGVPEIASGQTGVLRWLDFAYTVTWQEIPA